ncbi:hypothetical protein AYO44_07830 [Planctomycetaceae bacterium SCGC AG-212-F19]|nr:hypothetical protein AYO44_07830 [Planctomycetaceae bacterium SCGC AG-212-F19]
MRMFAKFLVFSNLILSLIFLSWAVALYTQRLDWAPHKNILSGEKDEKSGRLYFLVEEIKELVEHRDLAEKRWQVDADKLPKLEKRRLDYQQWYTDQISLAQTGRPASGGKAPDVPVIQLERIPDDKEGLFKTDPKERKAQQAAGQDLKSAEDYQKQYNDLKNEMDKLQAQIIKQVEMNEKLTHDIAGIPGKTTGLRKSVDTLILQKQAFDDEIEILKPLLAQQRINIEQQKRRLEEMEKRFKDLQRLAGLPALPPIREKKP